MLGADVGKLVFYVDECRPGNPLRPDRGRAVQCVYWTLSNLPHWYRSRRNGWFVFTIMLSKRVAELRGGVSALMRQTLRFFFQPCGWNFRVHGVRCPRDDGTVWALRAEFSCFLSDEKGLKETTNVKGSAGTKPCLKCKNVVGRVAVAPGGYFVHYK